MSDPTNTVLIVGASGVIGASAAAHFAALPGWRVLGVSRRPPDPAPSGYEHIALDLTDAAACRAAAGSSARSPTWSTRRCSRSQAWWPAGASRTRCRPTWP